MPSPIPLDNTLGALYIGVAASSVVFGINCMQSFLYFAEHSKRDGRFFKAFVLVLWILELLTVVLINHGVYFYSISNFGDLNVLAEPTIWSIVVEIGLSTFVAFMVQSFFAYRVYILGGGKKLLLPCIIMVLTLAQFAMGLVYTKVALSFKRFSGGNKRLRKYNLFLLLKFVFDIGVEQKPYVMTLFGLELAADFLIAASSIFYLRQHSQRSEVHATQHVIYVLIKYVVNTCLLEVLCLIPIIALASRGQFYLRYSFGLITYQWASEATTLIFGPFVLVLPRVYSLSLLCSLNNRDHLRDISHGKNGLVSNPSSGRTAALGSSGNNFELTTNSTQVQFQVKEDISTFVSYDKATPV
ncbi:hypothetical protein MVEN_00981500 [Mycena venus]|uniref:DUF6534 domain-containing protein n=1 Tax=Mycena venus TaxID=2733690 RepID=A0A8H7CZL9_9AGAR|nr:hypothetical protein MVEN_00981500 [Mycena venus]